MTAPNGFDLSLAPDVGAREDGGLLLELLDENDAPLIYTDAAGAQRPVTVRVAGTYSSIYRRTLESQKDRMLKQRRAKLSAEQLDRHQLELTATCILSWNGFVNAGEPFDCTPENKTMLLQRAPWIRQQIEAAQNDHAAFFRSSSTG